MAPYDSDSENDDQDFTETNVLLGYATKDATDDTTSQLGGHPTWLEATSAPSGDLAKCKNCNGLLTLLLQLDGNLPERFPGHERRLYVFACRKKTCRRKEGSVRGIRAVRASSIPEPEKQKVEEAKRKQEEEEPKPAPKTHIGESLFGVKPASGPGSSPLNPFSTGSSAATARANPFSSSTAPAPAPAAQQPTTPSPQQQQQQTPSLSETFASKARISSPSPPEPQGPKLPWPTQSSFPPPYPSYYLDADYETLDNEAPTIPQQTRVDMDIDAGEGSSNNATSTEDEKAAFESVMDKTFQKFADRMAQNPEQVLRYEFSGHPLLYSNTDPVGRLLSPHVEASSSSNNTKVKTSAGKSGMPRCKNCGAERVFELQLTPYAISELEAEELGIEGMEWGTVILGVCGGDCVERGQKEGEVGYVEEWVGVQWEELTAKK